MQRRCPESEEFIAGVKQRYGKFADDLLKAYPVGDTTVPKTARDLARDAAFGWLTWSCDGLKYKLALIADGEHDKDFTTQYLVVDKARSVDVKLIRRGGFAVSLTPIQ